MPITSAARRASPASSFEQQPREPARSASGVWERARWTPTTSCPASCARAAATAESTPPDIAASTFIGSAPSSTLPRPPRALDDLADHGRDPLDVGRRGGVPEREPQRAAGGGLVGAHREQ